MAPFTAATTLARPELPQLDVMRWLCDFTFGSPKSCSQKP